MDRLNILWTTADKDTVKNMLAMYAGNALRNGWWDAVNIIVWGGSTKLVAADEEIQKVVKELTAKGVTFEACLACAQRYDAVEIMESLGIDVKYMGVPLTDLIKGDEALLTL